MEKKFKGFSIPSGFTQTPNEFYDLIMRNELSLIEIRLLAFMMRYTFGWRKDGYCLQFSLGDLVKYLGFDKKQASNAIKQCLEKGYIEQNNIRGQNFYRLVLDESTQVDWTYEFEWKKVANWSEKDNTGSKKDNRGSKKDNGGGENDNTRSEKDNTGSGIDNQGGKNDNDFVVKTTTVGGEIHPGEVDNFTTPETPSSQEQQGFSDPLNISSNISIKDSKDKFEEEEDDDISITEKMNLNFFIEEFANKVRLPQAFIDKVINEVNWADYTPIVVQRACIKFRKACRMGQIETNPLIWFKTTLDNEEILYVNEFYNVK